ncbi:hypothetical protein C8T65DRAFT_261262 [Cerioporus squamosus]|nr:hypothetical protein C8T65DRAFT_261262 [Cerioporus squamosus]
MPTYTHALYPRRPTLRPVSSLRYVTIGFTIAVTIFTSPTTAQFDLTFRSMPSNIAQCTPVTISWSGGTPLFDLALVSSGATPLQVYTGLAGDSFQWSANISAGTTVSFQLTDAKGDIIVSPTALTIASGPDFCLPISTASTSQSPLTSNPNSLPSEHSSPTTSPTSTSVSESITKPSNLGPASYSGIAIAGAFALVGAIVLLVIVRRKCRRRVASRYPRDLVDLNESPRSSGAATPPWRDATIRQRPPLSIYTPSPRKLSQLYESNSPTSPNAIPLRELVRQQHVPFYTDPRADLPGPSGHTSKRSELERRGAIRSERISRPLPMPPGLGPTETLSGPTSPVLEQYVRDAARGPRQELDGGVRLAGGPPEEDWDRLSDILPTIPPPYRRYTT